MGGGGFTMEPDNPALDDFILTLARSREPKILFLPTASGDPNAQISAFRATFGDRACRPLQLSLFRLEQQPWRPARSCILSQDIVYVGGGSMRNLLAIWREHGIDVLCARRGSSGVVLAGISAGAMCWFQNGITRSAGSPAPAAGPRLPAGQPDRALRRRPLAAAGLPRRDRARRACPTATPPTTASASLFEERAARARRELAPGRARLPRPARRAGRDPRRSSSPSCSPRRRTACTATSPRTSASSAPSATAPPAAADRAAPSLA